MMNFLKGIIIGIGGIAPGLSGSVLMVIFGLYEKVVETISHIFKDFKKNVIFLLPLFLGIGVGVVIFSKIVDFFLTNFEMYTRFAFFGLIVGTIPLFYKQVKEKDFKKTYYIAMVVSFLIGIGLAIYSSSTISPVTNPNIVQKVFLGFSVAGSSIIPGVDSAAILSSMGLYELYVSSVASLDFGVLIPAGVGLAVGVLLISFLMNKLLKKYHALTFSILFGLFITIIPSVFNESCRLGFNIQSAISIVIAIIGFLASYFLSKFESKKEKQDQTEEI